MEETARPPESLRRYEITIAGKQFHISSRSDEAHIRRMERLLEETLQDMGESLEGKGLLTVALLAALNLADRVITAEAARDDVHRQLDSRLGELVGVLDRALAAQAEPVA